MSGFWTLYPQRVGAVLGSDRDCQQQEDVVSSLWLLGRVDGEAGRLVARTPILPILQAGEKTWVQDERWLGDRADHILPPV